ncbi:hypothetical protein B0G81_4340 [Paraburkholderia sp. BL6665CI2N2]|uniref:hypothetical protein n=1 Tax=Paraburkholderia sp. BL6665CI2N2 TaxID=1938806 RepID=UPI001065B460|nr:hypothetical protein [Paraburkholderia sp. BL6665CI2N2]TDY23938.1 hypothetical protein B0G81_4340 [Paraburkholderia sp. BL6665CI2N2]
MLTKENILAARNRKTEYVAIAGLGDMLGLRAMSGAERDSYLDLVRAAPAADSYADAALIARTAVDLSGSLIFSDADIAPLLELDATLLADLASEAARVNRIDRDSSSNGVPTLSGAATLVPDSAGTLGTRSEVGKCQ